MNLNCQMQNSDWDGLALGALTPQAAAPLVAHLRTGCAECATLFAKSHAAVLALGASLPGQAPSQLVEDKLASYVSKTKVVAMPAPRRGALSPWLLAAASLAFAAWMGFNRPASVSLPVSVPVSAPTSVPTSVSVAQTAEPTRVVDPNPDLQKRIHELELSLAQVRQQGIPAVAQPPLPPPPSEPLVVKVEDPEKDRQLNLYRERLQQLEALNQAHEKRLAELQQSRDKKLEQLNTRLAGLEVDYAAQKKVIDDYRNAFRTIESNGMKQVELASVDRAAQNSSARALYSKQGGLLVLAHDLPKLPDQKCYQLWILRKGSPSIVSGGLMKLDAQGRGFLQSPPTPALNDATGFAITDEPPGGSVIARGHKLLFGAI
ncbi:MAG: anti-sigma factor [Acidobacteria bacterium]|nr:anti-sigma factor [Acidobacteriota bacterium]